MKKFAPELVIILLLIAGVFLALCTDQLIEVNAMTGAERTKMRYGYVLNTAWKVRPTWIAESATRQGISTDAGWQYLSTVSKRIFYTSHACGRAPVAYPVRYIDPEVLDLTTTEAIDRFSREFVVADESKRARMITEP